MSSALDERSPWPYLAPTLVLFVLCVAAPRAWRGDSESAAEPPTALAASVWNEQSWWLATASHARRREQLLAAAEQAAEPDLKWLPIEEDAGRKPLIAAGFPRIKPKATTTPQPMWGEAIAPYTRRAPSIDELLAPAGGATSGPDLAPPATPLPDEPSPDEHGAKSSSIEWDRAVAALPTSLAVAAGPAIRLVTSETIESVGPKHVDASINHDEKPLVVERYLRRLETDHEIEDWADRCRAAWRSLSSPYGFASIASPTSRPGAELRSLAEEAYALSQHARSEEQAVALRRACDAVLRRAEFVELVHQKRRSVAELDESAMLRSAAAASNFLGEGTEADRWRSYLLLEELLGAEERSLLLTLASTAVQRTAPEQLTLAQARFLQSPVLAGFAASLMCAAESRPSRDSLLHDLEAYEQNPSYALGRALAVRQARLAASSAEVDRQIAERLQLRYRNANIRVVLHESLLNRLLPQEDPMQDRVNEVVVGVPVRGRSTTYSQLHVDLAPGVDMIAAQLHVTGEVHANTTSASGPAQLANHTQSIFFAQKSLAIDASGVHAWPAVADASSRSRLVRLMTDYDGVPVLGDLVRSVVKDRHRDNMPQARRETETKIERRAASEFDAKVAERVATMQARYEDEILSRIAALGLKLDVIDVESTEEQAVARVRLADDLQVAAYTPRPRAPQSSWASVQLHESAVNNFIERLALDGKDFNPVELQAYVVERLQLPAHYAERELPDDVVLWFAPSDSVRVDFGDDEIRLTLRLDGLECSAGYFEGFDFSVSYRLDRTSGVPRMIRDEEAALAGRPMGFRERIALHGVFSKMFPPDAGVDLEIPRRGPGGLELPALALTQILLDDGWLGLALGEPRQAAPAGLEDSIAAIE